MPAEASIFCSLRAAIVTQVSMAEVSSSSLERSQTIAMLRMLTLKRNYESPPVGPWSDYDYDVFDGDQRVGRIILAQQTPEGRPWFWAAARFPQSMDDHGYAASREQAMEDIEACWNALHPLHILVQPTDRASKVDDRNASAVAA